MNIAMMCIISIMVWFALSAFIHRKITKDQGGALILSLMIVVFCYLIPCLLIEQDSNFNRIRNILLKEDRYKDALDIEVGKYITITSPYNDKVAIQRYSYKEHNGNIIMKYKDLTYGANVICIKKDKVKKQDKWLSLESKE